MIQHLPWCPHEHAGTCIPNSGVASSIKMIWPKSARQSPSTGLRAGRRFLVCCATAGNGGKPTARSRIKPVEDSNKPPSTDSSYGKKASDKNASRPKKGKPGGRKGHKGHRQELISPTELNPPCDCLPLFLSNESPYNCLARNYTQLKKERRHPSTHVFNSCISGTRQSLCPAKMTVSTSPVLITASLTPLGENILFYSCQERLFKASRNSKCFPLR